MRVLQGWLFLRLLLGEVLIKPVAAQQQARGRIGCLFFIFQQDGNRLQARRIQSGHGIRKCRFELLGGHIFFIPAQQKHMGKC